MLDAKWKISEPIFEADAVCPDYRVWPWHGHRLFGYDLIAFLAPRLVVELGTYWGTSFFSFCQGVKDLRLATRCVAVDTWEGDEHTGQYGQKVYDTVKEISETIFGDVDIHLRRCRFNDAVSDFADESIDLLHIDGYHSYEAVREDFTTWLPKVAPQGIVLFHDIADSCDYGSVRYWRELLTLYPGFTFQHSWGLGVLFPKGDSHFKRMERDNIADKKLVYEYKSMCGLLRLQNEDGEKWRAQQDALIKQQEKKILEMSELIAALERQLHQASRFWPKRLIQRLGLGRRP